VRTPNLAKYEYNTSKVVNLTEGQAGHTESRNRARGLDDWRISILANTKLNIAIK